MNRVDPLALFGSELEGVERPSRYLGGERGAVPPLNGDFDGYIVALAFPDLYEIGMSNLAVRILYRGLNAIPGVRCERTFAVAPDYRDLLKRTGTPLYTIESGFALRDADMLAFSLSYELGAVTMLDIAALGGVPIRAKDRQDGDPIVIAGGPAITNPAPFGDFLDAAYIGEAEGGFWEIAARLRDIKRGGGGRREALEVLAREAPIWMPGKDAKRAVHPSFGSAPAASVGPIPVAKPVQDHGIVEIMRGCPNGCRFCHAGYFYRPARPKSEATIAREVEALVEGTGCKQVTLASLSSGDYPDIAGLMSRLNTRYAGIGLSFQLPSLKVSSFSLPILVELSKVRRGSLTFAVETPDPQFQASLNKDVDRERIVAIMEEAAARGFKSVKLYFMIGLPFYDKPSDEARLIVDFVRSLTRAMPRVSLSVNVASFVPKPHTPYEGARQVGRDEALFALQSIKAGLRGEGRVKVSYHDPFLSLIEGVIARGDGSVGRLLEIALEKGCGLDAWDEYFDKDKWSAAFLEFGWDSGSPPLLHAASEYPWRSVNLGVSDGYLAREAERSSSSTRTEPCSEACAYPCGACHGKIRAGAHATGNMPTGLYRQRQTADSGRTRLLFFVSRMGKARFIPHLMAVESFQRAFFMKGIPVSMTEGFNPSPRMELCPPIPLGFSSEADPAIAEFDGTMVPSDFITMVNEALPSGIAVTSAMLLKPHTRRERSSINATISSIRYAVLGPPDALQRIFNAMADDVAIHGLADSHGVSFHDGVISCVSRFALRKEEAFTALYRRSLVNAFASDPLPSDLEVRRMKVLGKDSFGIERGFEELIEQL